MQFFDFYIFNVLHMRLQAPLSLPPQSNKLQGDIIAKQILSQCNTYYNMGKECLF